MMGAFRTDPHLLQCQADLSSDVFAVIFRGDVHVARFIRRGFGRFSIIIKKKQIKFLLCTEREFIAGIFGIRNRLFQQVAGITFKRRAVRPGDLGEHLHDTSVLRAPWQRHQRFRFRMQKKVAPGLVSETCDGGCVDRDAVLEGAGQLIRHDGNVLLFAEHIAESKADELYVLLLHVLNDFLFGILHNFLLYTRNAACVFACDMFTTKPAVSHAIVFINLVHTSGGMDSGCSALPP